MSVEVSVILPTFNRSRSLPAAISSVLTQTTADLELIVVDDGSSEDIEGLVRGFNDARLKYVRRPENGGAAAARNTGLAHAQGAYIAFQDSDDLWLPHKLATQLALFARLPADVGVVTGPKILYAPLGRSTNGTGRAGPSRVVLAPPGRRLQLEDDQVGRLLDANRLSVQCALFKRSHLPQGEWFDHRARANEDWEFAVRLARHARIYEDAEPVLLGFVSGDSISTNRRKQITGVLRILKYNRAALQQYRRQRSALMLDVGRALYKTGKPRWGFRFVLSSIASYPLSVVSLGQSALGKFRLLPEARRHPGPVT